VVKILKNMVLLFFVWRKIEFSLYLIDIKYISSYQVKTIAKPSETYV